MSDTPRARSTSGDPAVGESRGATDRPRSREDRPRSPKVRHRPSWIVFVILGAAVCLGMGFWQLSRYQAVSGTVQNLGYTFMWPFLAGFLVYAYLKYIRLEAEQEADRAAEDRDAGSGAAGARGGGPNEWDEGDDDEVDRPSGAPVAGGADARRRRRRDTATEIPADILPTRRAAAPVAEPPDEGLRAYNEYLADLARQDRAVAERTTTTRPSADQHQEKPAT